MFLKRLWDTENKKTVRAIGPSGKKCQIWTNDDGSKLYVYDHSKWIELQSPQSLDVETYGPVWKALDDEEVGFYLTNEPTNLYNWDSGDEVAYRFMNGTTVLESGTIDEGETPEYTGDTPTKSATAQYTYTFSGWKPTVGPITKKTDYKAQFTSTVNDYTITWKDGDDVTLDTDTVAYGGTPEYTGLTPTKTATAQYTYTWDEGWTPAIATVTGNATYTATYTATVNKYTITFVDEDGTTELDSQELDYGATPVYAGETPTKASTAQYTYTFSGWTPDIATVTADATYTAVYSSEVNQYEVSIASDDETMGTVDVDGVTVDYGTSISASSNVLTIGETEITATAGEGYAFAGWTDDNGDPLPETVTGTLSIVATFDVPL